MINFGLVVSNLEGNTQRVIGSLPKCGLGPPRQRSAALRDYDDAGSAGQRMPYSGLPIAPHESGADVLTMPLKRIATFALGWIVVLAGIAGLFLPVVPGGVLIVAGVLLLSPHCAWLRRTAENYRARSHVLNRVVRGFSALRTKVCEARFAAMTAFRIHFLRAK